MTADFQFNDPEWKVLPKSSDFAFGWEYKDGLVIGVQRLGLDKGLRSRLNDVHACRKSYREEFAKQGLGLIECDLVQLDGVPGVRAIGKLLLKPHGAAYAGTIALPLPRETWVFNVIAREMGITGVRETAVTLKLMTELDQRGLELVVPEGAAASAMAWKNTATGEVLRWSEDPYESTYYGPCLRNLADAPEHDQSFPDHPLSRVRFALECLTRGMKLSTALRQQVEGKRRWWFW